ncbi:MAG TPA: hypothetical protein VFF24_11240 [Acidimicrobiia bacterium]|jgi:hypothetical protein|nr:hypothetical protein [Acidimicrobiia bacterium]
MMCNEYVARELVADRFRTLQQAYSPDPRPRVPRRSRRSRRLAIRRPNPGPASLAAGHG